MLEITDRIMAEIESDPSINAREVSLDVASKGVISRKKTINVYGMVESADERGRIVALVKRLAGSTYEVSDKLIVI